MDILMSGLKEKVWRKLPLIIILTVVILGVVLAVFSQRQPFTSLQPYVAQITITGTIDYSSSSILGTTTGVEEYIRLIKQAEEDPLAKAVIIVFDSPGGTVTASDDLYQAVKSLASKKLVVAYAKGLMASGAYMAALPAKVILASPTSEVGSVGVIMTVLNVENLLGKLGITVYTFKSGTLKDIGSPYRNMTEQEIKIMNDFVNYYFEIFKERVIMNRGKVSDEVFTGQPFTPVKAKEAGLIDDVCTYEEAVNRTKSLAGLPEDAPVIELKPRTPSLLDILFGASQRRSSITIPSIVVLAMWPPPVAIVLP
jgi:protease-4